MRILIGAVSALAMLTAGAYAQTVNLGSTPDSSSAQATDGNPILFPATTNSATADSPNSVKADPVAVPLGIDNAAASDTSGPDVSANDGEGTSASFNSIGNGALVLQQGNGNDGFVVQTSEDANSHNQGLLIQTGNGNLGLLLQDENYNEASAVQNGDENTLVIRQREFGSQPDADQQAAVFQFGNSNAMFIDQIGDSNAAAAVQAGNFNELAILQASAGNGQAHQSAAVVQLGNGNELLIGQNFGTTDFVTGSIGAPVGIINVGGSNPVGTFNIDADDILDDPSNANSISPVGIAVLNSINNAAAFQAGDNNAGVILQNGNGNNAGIVQISD